MSNPELSKGEKELTDQPKQVYSLLHNTDQSNKQ